MIPLPSLSSSSSAASSLGPVNSGPVTVNVAGFRGEATAQTRASQVPAAGEFALDGAPPWILPAAIVAAAVVIALAAARRG